MKETNLQFWSENQIMEYLILTRKSKAQNKWNKVKIIIVDWLAINKGLII